MLPVLLVCVWLPMSLQLIGAEEMTPRKALMDKILRRNMTTPRKYPTAVWSAKAYEEEVKKQEKSKLYLFKPSPFLKPPFTEGDVGASISGIDDGIMVTGHRKGMVNMKLEDAERMVMDDPVAMVDMTTSEPPKDMTTEINFIDRLLEQSLAKYLESSNLTSVLGHISVEDFSEALKRITQEKRVTTPLYDMNKELHKKFRDEMLAPKKYDGKPHGGLLEKQYQRRFQNINENSIAPPKPQIFEEATTSTTEDPLLENNEIPTPKPTKLTTNHVAEDRFPTAESMNIYFSSLTTQTPLTSPAPRRKTVWRGSKKWKDTVLVTDLNWNSRSETDRSVDKESKSNFDDGELQLSVAETVYYRPRQTPLNTFNFDLDGYGAIPGEPNKDYPMLSVVPQTGFKCPEGRSEGPWMVADPKTRCQVFYICSGNGPPAPMLCPNGTVFNENVFVCDWWFNVDC